MRVFKEEQRFTQWWLIAIFTIVILGILLNFFSYEKPLQQFSTFSIVSKTIGIIIGVGIFLVKMRTRIDKSGVEVWFSPFRFTRKSFTWKELEKAHTRKYKPVTEYGGWGIRGLNKPKAYNVKGNKGIQLKTRKGRYFLIGTQQPDNVDRVIRRYFNNSEQ
ncbi:hypothetical protein [Zunongwangia sp. HGR-M22]|uniref:hypothetical protein n=1 Tax=Zunongwangia sp. HGR-M22 TaxID=3015168 RepID=UPI0022DE1E0E|nr:hypothetical protein [Zunongwangia sp. HGR-M22]WBL24800.1 hypothetical protein PBT91_12885 [Zunongwangia sp. HGR-M22]